MKSNIFVYGRTKNQDYRWLQKPNVALNSSFFARILENNSNSLKRNEKLFIFISTPDLYMLAYIFKDFSSIDERGRPITFVVGLTYNPLEGREFNYRLPALLQQHNLITDLIKNDLTRVINTNSFFNIENFDISKVTYIKNEKFISDLEHDNTTLNSSILEIAKELNNKAVTPNLESNFHLTDINNILKEEKQSNNNISTPSSDSEITNINSVLKEEKDVTIEGGKKINNNISIPNTESNSRVTDVNNILEETNNSIVKGEQESKQRIIPSRAESNIKIVDNTPPKGKTESKAINQLNNFISKDKNKQYETTKIVTSHSNKINEKIHLKNELEEIIKFRPSSILARLYKEEGEDGGIFTPKICFTKESFIAVYKKLQNYDKQIINICEKVEKVIDETE